ncbi:unnamed protein product [Ectocarpus fasciculatus]
MSYVSASVLTRKYGVSKTSARRWRLAGILRSMRTPGGHYRYLLDDIVAIRDRTTTRRKIAYCRVSSSKQKDDLCRQVQCFQNTHPEHEIVKDIGSGINFKRKGLLRVVDAILEGNVEEIVIAHRDRLCRFAFDFLEWICRRGNTRIVVQDQVIRSSEQELTEDLVAIIHVFSCKLHGSRRYRNKGEKDTSKTGERTGESAQKVDEVCETNIQRSSKARQGQEGQGQSTSV